MKMTEYKTGCKELKHRLNIQFFGGRGASSGGSGSSGGGAVYTGDTSLNINGDQIDLSNSPLIYGDLDSALAGNARTVIEQFESRRYGMKSEYSRFIDSNGNIIEDNHGGKSTVGASYNARMTADAMSHNHPRGNGVIGGTFSDADISNFARFNQKTYRATAKEGTYSISKTGFFNKRVATDYKNYVKPRAAQLKADGKRIIADYNNRKIGYSDAVKQLNSLNNAFLVDTHNWLLNNQSNYGYTYTLERRQ